MTDRIAPRYTSATFPSDPSVAPANSEVEKNTGETAPSGSHFSSLSLELASMMIKLSGETRGLERSLERADRRAQRALEAKEIQELRTEANAVRVSGFLSGAAGVASSAFHFASIAKLDKGSETAASKLWENVGKTSEAAGAFERVPLDGVAKDAQIAAKEFAARAGRAAERVDDARTAIGEGAAFENRLLERASQLSEAEAQCRAASILRA